MLLRRYHVNIGRVPQEKEEEGVHPSTRIWPTLSPATITSRDGMGEGLFPPEHISVGSDQVMRSPVRRRSINPDFSFFCTGTLVLGGQGC